MIKRSADDWQKIIKAQQSSGLNQTQFCQQHGLNPKYFSGRKKQLSKAPVSSFVKVAKTCQPSSVQSSAVLHYQDMRLQLDNASPGFIAELVKCLA